jgi:hypothetical protein
MAFSECARRRVVRVLPAADGLHRQREGDYGGAERHDAEYLGSPHRRQP